MHTPQWLIDEDQKQARRALRWENHPARIRPVSWYSDLVLAVLFTASPKHPQLANTLVTVVALLDNDCWTGAVAELRKYGFADVVATAHVSRWKDDNLRTIGSW